MLNTYLVFSMRPEPQPQDSTATIDGVVFELRGADGKWQRQWPDGTPVGDPRYRFLATIREAQREMTYGGLGRDFPTLRRSATYSSVKAEREMR